MTRGAPRTLLAVSLALASGWPLALWLGQRAGALDVVLASYATLLLVVLWLAGREVLRPLLVFRPKPALVGAALGAALVVSAHLAYPHVARALPFVAEGVHQVYAGLSGSEALFSLALVALAEEMLFRGVLIDALSARMRAPWAWALAIGLYALAQVGAGIALLPLLAFGFGGVFALERRLSQSLVAPVATHLVWTLALAVAFPITP